MKEEEILNKRISINEELICWNEIDLEIIYLHNKERQLYELTKTASFIWRELADGKNVNQVIKALQTRYKREKPETIKQEAFDFIKSLIKQKVFLMEKS